MQKEGVHVVEGALALGAAVALAEWFIKCNSHPPTIS